MMTNQIDNPIAQNRAEELGYDLWDEFVIPPYYDNLDLLSAKKPRVIVGGRGCGKTMLLRYLCHQSQFSLKRKFNNDISIKHIGIYWKIDTQFAKILTKRGIDEIEWQSAFEHMSTLVISREVIKSLESIASSSYKEFDQTHLEEIDFSNLKDFIPEITGDINNLKRSINKLYNQFQLWASNFKRYEIPIFLPKGFATELINCIYEKNTIFKNATYYVYIDEYENLLKDQQCLINTWLKHSEPPLVFNIAMKREAFNNKSTIGNEQLVSIHDYREYDLEAYFDDNSVFNLFAAEILFLRLFDKISDLPIDRDVLRSSSSEAIVSRRNENYKKRVTDYAKKYFPSPTYAEIANEILNDVTLYKRLVKLINNALDSKQSKRNAEDFISKEHPSATVVMFALLNRSLEERLIIEEFEKLKSNQDNNFTGNTGWVDNNLVGCILFIYEPLPRQCKVYSGFNTFCKMSRSNIRHFLELCNRSINIDLTIDGSAYYKPVEPEKQAEGAKQASTSLLKEINQFGNNGVAIHKFIVRLGMYFAVQQRNPSQSEPEQNHFSIKNGISNLEIRSFISECIKWSVLYEVKLTKRKGGSRNPEIEESEYTLNPIYTPYFDISFRKKRRAEMRESELITIVSGNDVAFKELLAKKSKYLDVILEDSKLPLFEYFKKRFNED
ncbi:hypothetical protein [Spirosoma luteum]|uniref:ORC-CDC6 family AAA ATPase n=1 Tax=Spirosoma luteum TaxID=431553 RepID=UPI0003619306|nr:hypothetical protein [Spirosoma luteum]